eukprot:scaffold500_cov112-Isochrysis_galbana.AAC.1
MDSGGARPGRTTRGKGSSDIHTRDWTFTPDTFTPETGRGCVAHLGAGQVQRGAHVREVHEEWHIRQFFPAQGEKPNQPLVRSELLSARRVEPAQQRGDEGGVVHGCGPHRSPHVMDSAAVGAVVGDGWPRPSRHALVRAPIDHPCHGLQRERVATRTRVEVRHLRGGQLDTRLAGPHPHKHPDVEIDVHAQQGRDVAAVAGGVRVDAGQKNAERLLVAVLGLEREGAVLRVAGLRVGAG